jgi:hypothetical protein
MRMMQIFLLAAILLGTTILAAPVRAGAPSLDQEAEVEAHKYLRTIFTQCGDDYFSKQVIPQPPNVFAREKTARKSVPEAYTIEQYHQFTTSITPKPLTTADTLNGIEWHGTIDVSAAAKREFSHGQSALLAKPDVWTDWQAMKTNAPEWRGWPGIWAGLRFYIAKKQGQWTVAGESERRQAPDCATIPK